MKSVTNYFCLISAKTMKMKNLSALMILAIAVSTVGCGKLLKKSSKGLPTDGHLHGVGKRSRDNQTTQPGMVYVPPGTLHMGPSDEDVNYAYTARNKQISISGFWMDATEITNNEYRQFVYWVRVSIEATNFQYGRELDGRFVLDWKKAKTIKWQDKSTVDKI